MKIKEGATNMGKLSSRQVGMLLFISIISTKFVLLPAIMVSIAGVESYFTLIIRMALDILTLIVCLWIINKNPNINFKECLEHSVGKAGSKIILVILYLYFSIKVLMTLKSMQNYMVEVLFDEFDLLHFLVPTMALLGFVIYKDLKVLARGVEFIFYAIFGLLIFGACLSLGKSHITNLVPFFDNGIEPIFNALLHSTICFGDYLVLLIIMGKYTPSKENTKRLWIYVFMGIGITVLFYINFVAVFGRFSVAEPFAISDIILNTNSPETIARLDWLIIIVWLISLILQCSLSLFCANECLCSVINFKHRETPVLINVVFFSSLLIIFASQIEVLIKLSFGTAVSIVLMVIQFGIPLILLCSIPKRRAS